MDQNNRNFILAIALSMAVLLGWQFFYGIPKMEQEKARQELARQQATRPQITTRAPVTPGTETTPRPSPGIDSTPRPAPGVGAPSPVPNAAASRNALLKATKRIPVETPSLTGSIPLTGGRIDDLTFTKYRQTVKKDSPNVALLSPAGGRDPFYAEYGWVGQATDKLKLPGKKTPWTVEGGGVLTPTTPVVLKYDNGKGLRFRRTISVDEDYMFTVMQEVENRSSEQVILYPYALVSRHGTPKTSGFYVLHEGLVGVVGEEGLQELDYSDVLEDKTTTLTGTAGWVGITDKYWGAVVIPDQGARYQAHFTGSQGIGGERYQADYLLDPVTIPPGGKASVTGKLFAGAKQVNLVDGYERDFKIKNFDLLIDWGWFYFITKPLFFALDWFFRMFGNFGVAILAVTVLVKIIFFPLANKSYVSMGKMKKLQPEMTKIRERFKDDKVKQQQEMMALYQKEKVNPMSGCLPILIQIPVFFALYKVIFVTIEMRHAPFFGWIKDLSAADPTSLFNLFGLLPYGVPTFLQIGVWPLIMGITMWVQMKLNPQQADPMQQRIFNWMPVFFTFLLGTFPAGLVIYWAWNNFLSVVQQWVIMSRQGVEVRLFENMGIAKLWGKVSSLRTGKS